MAFIKRSKRGSRAKKPKSSVSQEELQSEEQRISAELRSLQRMVKEKKEAAEFARVFESCSKRHQEMLRKGKKDENFEELLDTRIQDLRKKLMHLKVDLESRQGESFFVIVPSGARDTQPRSVALLVNPEELYTLIRAISIAKDRLTIADPGHKPLIDRENSVKGAGSLSTYLLRCAIESGIGWKVPDHEEFVNA